MTNSPATPPTLPSREKVVVLRPGFLRAWRGIWSFTWRTQFNMGRWPGLLVTLLAIPLLAYFTLETLKLLTTRYEWREQPRQQVEELKASLNAAQARLERGAGTKISQIILEEQNRLPTAEPAAEAKGALPFSEEAIQEQIEQARACHERIAQRVRPLLNAKQFDLFQKLRERKIEEAVTTIKKFNLQALRPFYRWLIDFYFLLVLPLYCLSACGSMIRDELQGDTLGFLTTRPVGRARLFLIKYLCQIIWLQGLAAVHGLLLFGAGFARDVPGVGALMGLFLGAQFLAVMAWGALSALLGLITRRYLVLGIVYGFVVELGIGRIPTNINSLALTRHLQALLSQNPLLGQLYEWAPQETWFSVGMLLLATAIFLGIATALFKFREYHHAAEMQR